jgi:histone H3/H4
MKKAIAVQYVTDEHGRKTSVILPVETYEEIFEDIQDLVAVAERRKEKTVSFDDMKKRLKERWSPLK